MKKSNVFFRALALSLIILCVLPLLVSCKGRALAQTSLAKQEVGTVGNYTVQYEEFYAVANRNYIAMKDQYGSDTEGLKKAVWDETVKDLASYYYAILTLCEAEGIKYDEKELRGEIDDYVEQQIEANFDGSRSDYLKSQQEAGITDHYARFTFGIELMYKKLRTKYQESGVVPNTDEKITAYIKDNFIHTWHLAVVVNEGEDRSKCLDKAEGLLERLNNGESFFSLMKYSEDFSSNNMKNAEGTYFHKGEMTQEYEDASLALKINGISEIVTSTAQIDGRTFECFYIIQRLPVKDAEIQDNFEALSDKVVSAMIAEKVHEIKNTLTFTPNDYAKSLDVTNLEQPKNGPDYQAILMIAACVIIAIITVTSIFIIVITTRTIKRNKFKKLKQKNQLKSKN